MPATKQRPKKTPVGPKRKRKSLNEAGRWKNRIVGQATVPASRLIPNDRNWRLHPEAQKAALAGVLDQVGWVQRVIVNKRTGKLVDGHERLAQALAKGPKQKVPVLYVDLSPEEEALILASLDPISALATKDEDILQELAGDLPVIESDALEALIGGLVPEALKDELTDPDQTPTLPTESVTVSGDLWLCGRHRVLCADSTSRHALRRLCGGEKVDVVFTDPPYGIGAVKGQQVGGGGRLKFGKVGGGNWVDSKTYAEIAGDDSTETAKRFYHACLFLGLERFIIWGGNYFTDFLPPSRCWIVWDKQNTGHFADVEMAWVNADRGAKLYSWVWNGLSRSGARKDELKTRIHPTQKPVGLFEQIFKDFNFSSCLDGFLGSGSTLVACEKTGRRCFGSEFSPAYVDLAVIRWQDFTGKKACNEDGELFESVARSRRRALAA